MAGVLMTCKHLKYLCFVSVLALAGAGAARAADPGKTNPAPLPPGFAGQFLSSHHAQARYDWRVANEYLAPVLAADPGNADLIRRSMILAMGEGDLALAAGRARQLAALKDEDDNSLAHLILVIDGIAAGRTAEAKDMLDAMPASDVADFIRPVLRGWLAVAGGKLDTDGLNATTIHSYSGALMALSLGKKSAAADMARRFTQSGTLSLREAERAGDLFAAAGLMKEAANVYAGLLKQEPQNRRVEKKLALVQKDRTEELKALLPPLKVTTPAQGVAVALYDMAGILMQEASDSSAKLFAQMALALDPSITEARLLLGNALAQNGRYDDALRYFDSIGTDSPDWLEIRRYMAELLHQAGRTDEAHTLLNNLFKEHNDVESLIRIGDLYRTDEDFNNALKAYNRAAGEIGNDIPEEYWHLLYARGMVYERTGAWDKAESDLKAALGFRPDHPYLLNYLGYGWADQGKNLEESLKLLERAAELRPDDGYIADSLGWVLFRMGRYAESVPHLEKAVELMPYDSTINDHLGDAYWKVGRRLEARFQWERALNNAEDEKEEVRTALRDKLANGLISPSSSVKEARSATEDSHTAQ